MANRAEIFCGNSRDYYLSISDGNHDLDAFLKKLNFWRENGRGRHAGAKRFRASRPDQKVVPSGGTFGSTVISEKRFRKFRA